MSDRLTPILSACRQKIEAAGFAIGGVTLPVLVRKAATFRLEMDPKRMITLAKSGTPEETTRRRFGLWQTRYLIDAVVHAPAGPPEMDQSPYATVRDGIVSLFLKPPLAGAPDVFDLDAAPADWLRPYSEGATSSVWDWFSVQIAATVSHQ